MKGRIKENVFNGEFSKFNGRMVNLNMDSTNNPVIGKSGKTKQYSLTEGGHIYLTDDQVELIG